ncbi:hypothetical protein [Sphingomonas gilva]|nr:hypothetical protein [Sphingomonas gilva]
MSKIVELDAEEVTEVAGGRRGIVEWFESVFGSGPPPTTDYHWTGVKG